MKPVAFEYCRADTLDEALELLKEFGGDASVISGGMSLGAMLNMRLVRPQAVIDINRIEGLSGVAEHGLTVETGALMRQATAQRNAALMEAVPLLADALPHVGHYQTRARGTLGGSVAHADPSAEIPLCLVTLDGTVKLRGASGRREVPAREFFHGVLTTDRRADELVVGLTWPVSDHRTGYAFEEIAQRHGDFAICAAAAVAKVDEGGAIEAMSFGLGGVEDRPYVVDGAPFVDRPATLATAQEIADAASEDAEPMVDLQANADYRRQLVRVLGAKALARAFAQAMGTREAA